MEIDTELYQDREQSFIKHLFLTKYLQAAAFKILQVPPYTFNFVDAFAGPWRVRDVAECSDASFDQAINTLESVRDELGKRGRGGLKIRFCFCERDPKRAAKLREYADQKKRFEIYIFPGAFEDNLDAIAKVIPNGFTFTFIDPTGWDIRNGKVFGFLRNLRGEFLFNFMADPINRHTKLPTIEPSIGRFLDVPNWPAGFAALPSNWSSEKRILHLLKTSMKMNKVATYLPDFSIKLPREERIKMRLILGTHSVKGLEVFRDVQSKVELREIEVRNGLRDGENPQESLFTAAAIAAMQQGNEGVGCKRNQEQSAELVKNFLGNMAAKSFEQIAVEIMERIPMRITQIKKLVMDMRAKKLVEFELQGSQRKPQDDTQISLTN